MGDALRAVYGAVGVQVTYGAGLEADLASAWTHDFPSGRVHHTWVATQMERVWVGRGDEHEVLEPGGVAILAGGAPTWVGTRSARNPPPRVEDPLFPVVGVHHGEVAFGPLMPEVLGLPDVFSTMRPQDDGWDTGSDVVLTLQHLGSLVGQRWPGPPQDALAEMVVTTALSTWRPPVLRDNSLSRCIDAIAGTGSPPTVPELAALANTSQSTLRRRFRSETGLTPDEFSRWFRTLPVRRDLLGGLDPTEVAARFGFPTVRSMRRTLDRVERSLPRLRRAETRLRILD